MTAVSQDWHELISQPVHSDRVNDYDVVIPMRDGIKLTADVHRPKTDESVPALLAFQPWGKDHEALGLRFPQQRRPNTLWDGSIEGGDTQYFVSRGYAHIVVDARGTGAAEGELAGIMGTGPGGEGRDIHDVIEWLAEQPWCDGNVGMVGISYLAAVQLLAAAQHPPHLKAIFPEGGHYDTYGHCYHGGILWMMPRAALRGRGGDSGLAVAHPRSFTRDAVGEETFQELLAQRLEDPDVAFHPNYHQLLKYPDIDPIWLDYILQCYDGEFWWGEGAPDDRFAKVEIPVHLGVQLGRGWQVDETIAAFQGVRGERRLAIRPGPPMQERPFHEFHDEMIRWFDHWMKGNDTGMLEGPAIRVFVENANKWRHSDVWPLPGTIWRKFYLRSSERLLPEPETLDEHIAPPDGFYQAPMRVSNQVGTLIYRTPAFTEATELIGPAALHLSASIDTEDTNWIVTIYEVTASGQRNPFSTGWLKASHRELDESRSEPHAPHHPHTRSEAVPPGEIVDYAIKIYPFSRMIPIGHSVELEIRSVEHEATVNPMLPPESSHLNSARATTHKIYRDCDHQSHLLLPIAAPYDD